MSNTSEQVLEKIRNFLKSENVTFREIHHEPTYTSEDSARARGEELRVGGKALLIKTADEFCLFVLPANRKLDSQSIRRTLLIRKTRFATSDELMDLTGLVPGSVPPFGEPILPFPLYLDLAIQRNDRIAFNAGSLTDSIVMPMEDYRRIAHPKRIFRFSQKTRESEDGTR